MFNRLLPFTILTLSACALWGQTPQAVTLQAGGQLGSNNNHLPMACIDQYAGTISFSNFIGQSNDIDLDTIYFCEGDQINIVHNGDADLTGDPNPFSVPGITYGFFDCPPTVSGPNLAAILADPCLTDDPPPLNNIWVTAGGMFSGNITFSNGGGLQNTFNGGDPVLLWFAPLTIDNFAVKQYEVDAMSGEIGPCVNLNVDEAFAAVYLNAIQTSNFATIPNSSGCGGQFTITGGLPEFDGSDYTDVSITLIGNPDITGTVINNAQTHGGTIQFTVPTPGFYTVVVEDGKSCGVTFTADMSSCISVAQSIQNITGAPGDNICINVTNDSGFTDIVSMQYGISWDPAILQFTNITNLTPNLPNYSIPSNFNVVNDTLIFAWASFSGTGVTLPPGEVLYQICFDIVGVDGDCNGLEYITPMGSTIEVVNENGAVLGFNGIDGESCVSNSALVIDILQDSVSCSGDSDGSFTATVSGGTPPYSVSWQSTTGGSSGGPGIINVDGGSFTAMGLEADTYSVTITDDQGTPLTVVENVEVLGPPVLAILFSVNPGPCNGDLGGVISTLILDSNVVISPQLSYDYLWSNMETGTSINNLNSGFYSLTVTEIASGCTVEDMTFLPNNPPLTMNVVYDTSSCSGVADGSISVSVSGGVPDMNGDYTIELPTAGIGVTVIGTMANVMGMMSDTYPVIITDANGCTIEQDLFLPATKVLSFDVQITDINCSDACSGALFLTGITTGGVPGTPYNFDWFGSPPPPPPTNTTPTTSTLGNICEGTYWVVMEDNAGCEIVDTFVFIEPSPIDVTVINVFNESCNPGMDGSITIGVDGGEWPYTYAWNGSTATDSTATGLSAGMYTVTVEDVSGCFDTITATVSSPTPPEILNFPNDTLDCINSTDGSLTVTASADVTSIDWSNGDVGPTIGGLSPGEYIVTVTNDESCTAVDTAYVESPPPLVLDSIVTTAPQCPGLGGGSINVFVSGGTSPYLYEWSNGVMGVGFTFIGGATVTAGAYDVTITDANDCMPSLIVDVTLDDPPSIVADFSLIDSVSCANSGMTCDGTATAAAMYSDGSMGTFDFTWISGELDNGTMTSTASLLCEGMQELTISDGTCFEMFEVDIPAPADIDPEIDIENITCNGLMDGSITVLPEGGTPPYSIIWGGGETDFTIDGLIVGIYQATITDSKGCNYTQAATITEPAPLVLSLNNTETFDVTCNGFEDGIISVIATGGNIATSGDLIYSWQNGVASSNSSVADSLPAGTYAVTVIDSKGCEDSLTHTLVQPPPIQFSIADFDPINCFGQNTFITVDSVWGGVPTIYRFNVNGGAERNLGDLAAAFAGENIIEVVDQVNKACKVDTTITITQPGELMIELPEIVEIELGDTMTFLDPVIVPSIPIDSFLWSPPNQLTCTDCKNPMVIATQNQLYTLTIWDINGCTTSADVLVDIDRNRNVFIPNIFSPNGDGINDKFRIYTGPGVTKINYVKVYDRWGELVFDEPSAPLVPNPDGTPGWDGRLDGNKMNPAVFLYLVEVEFFDGQLLLYRGDVTLIR